MFCTQEEEEEEEEEEEDEEEGKEEEEEEEEQEEEEIEMTVISFVDASREHKGQRSSRQDDEKQSY